MINDAGEQYICEEIHAILRKMHVALESYREVEKDGGALYNKISESYTRLQCLNLNLETGAIR